MIEASGSVRLAQAATVHRVQAARHAGRRANAWAGTARGVGVRDAAAATVTAAMACLVLAADVVVAASRPGLAAITAGLGTLVGMSIVGAAGASLVRRPDRWSGPADRITLTRATLTAGCATLAVPMVAGVLPSRSWALMLLLVPALALDAVDGRVARRTGTATPSGGLLDGEMDAAVLLVLSLAATRSLGLWVLGIGLMRYAFYLAGRVRPKLRGRLAFSQFRRVVAASQGVALAIGLAPVVPVVVGRASVGLALALLTVSFGLDVRTLEVRTLEREGITPRPSHRVGAIPHRGRPAR